mmetsp:Transcript_7885/g.10055  ORF Transcript_7885/g.10055 Transcript_7885/m.10055 type:complete len:97 (-) Transcript_7885:240-530(-)
MPKLGFSGVRTRQRSSTELANGEAAKANDNNPLLSSDNSGGMSSSEEISELIDSSYVTMTNGRAWIRMLLVANLERKSQRMRVMHWFIFSFCPLSV